MHRPRRMGLMRQSSAVIGDAGDHTPSKPQVCHHQAMYRHIRQNTPLYPDSSFIILPPRTWYTHHPIRRTHPIHCRDDACAVRSAQRDQAFQWYESNGNIDSTYFQPALTPRSQS